MKKMGKAVIGNWRITSMEVWDANYFDMEVPAHITIRKDLNPAAIRWPPPSRARHQD